MAPKHLTVELVGRTEWEDADGTPCFYCGEVSYLNQCRIVVELASNGKRVYSGDVLCQSCGEITEESET